MTGKYPQTRWNGSNAAMAEHAAALAAHPVRLKPKKKTKKQKRREAGTLPRPDYANVPYAEYLQSKWWKIKRWVKLKSTKGRCERCGGKATQVHHKHYRTVGREKNIDLESICGPCHKREHEALIQAKRRMASI
jgi:5-methylcytosine-specific restriction endonuclease McrA